MFVYSGLINSRCGNETSADIISRVQKLIDYADQNRHVTFLLGTVVMRIPAYNTVPPVEDPYYWAYYGLDIYTYSFYLSKYNHTHNETDYQTAMAAAAKVPTAILADWVNRRQRNFNATVFLLEAYAKSVADGAPLFHSMYITQDDNAQYGFNIDEATALKQLVSQLGLSDRVLIYPGADEVGLSMLSRLTVDTVTAATDGAVPPPALDLVFRRPDNASLYLIPNYEGQPMIATLLDQIRAAGAAVAPGDWTHGLDDGLQSHSALDDDAAAKSSSATSAGSAYPNPVLLVNNFGTDEYPQIEAPSQTTAGRSSADYDMFTPYACGSDAARANVLSVADNRYSNGADVVVVQYLLQLSRNASCAAAAPTSNPAGLGLDRLAFAGWNTDGNTVGTAISNLVLLHYFAAFGKRGAGAPSLVERIDAWAAQKRRRVASPTKSIDFAVATIGGQRQVGSVSEANAYFNTLRFVEDCYWQAQLRQTLVSYLSQVNGEGPDTLADDLPFYERYALKVLNSRAVDLSSDFGAAVSITTLFYPWNRTFEIGMVGPGSSPLI